MDLSKVVNEIGLIADNIDTDKWKLAEAINTAYSELPAYEKNLTSGIVQRCKFNSTTMAYNYRNAWDFRSQLGNSLSVSHNAKLYDLRKKYDLSEEEVRDYIKLAEEESWSVKTLGQEVYNNHAIVNLEEEEKLFKRLLKDMRSYFMSSHIQRFSKETRAVYYDLLKELEDGLSRD